MQELRKTADRFRQGNYIRLFLINFIFMAAVYFSMYSNGLVNQWDGIWEYNYYKAGRWSISLGRWLWPFLDRIKMGLGTEPLSTISACALFALGITIAFFFIYDQKKASGKAWVYAFLFLGSASVCVSLSYRYMSATYGFAFLFSILAVFCLAEIKKPVPAVIAAGFLIAAQMGLYQAYIGCTGLLIVVWLLAQLAKEKSTFKQFGALIGRAVCAVILGGGLYLVGLKVCLRFSHTTPASYKGMADYSILNTILNLGRSTVNAYRVFTRFFFSTDYRTNLFMNYSALYYTLAAVIAVALLINMCLFLVKLFKQNIVKGILGTALFLLSPVAVNAVLLIATDTETAIQMTVALALYLPVMFCYFDNSNRSDDAPSKKNVWKIAGCAEICLVLIFLYGTVLQIQVDQEAMRTGILCVTNMAEVITEDLNSAGYLDGAKPICAVGVPSGNKLYSFPIACEGANYYAIFGSWGTWSDWNSWKGVFQHLIVLNIEYAEKEQSNQIRGNSELEKMPCFPEEGYIKEIDDVIVIKVSDVY